MEKVLFIINPVAGRGHGRRIANIVAKKGPKYFDPVILFTKIPGDELIAVKNGLEDGIKKFVAVGGDGTVNKVASALVHSGGAMGIIPVGSGNGLARHLKLTGRLSHLFKIIAADKIKVMDYGLIDNHPFFCVSGIGFDARVGQLFATGKGRGFFSYVNAAVKEYFIYKPKKYRLIIDGDKVLSRRAFLISFANSSQYGNHAYISPKADVSDGLLDVCILRPFHIFRTVQIVYGLFGKKLTQTGHLEIIKCTTVEVLQKNSSPVHFDGEPGMVNKRLEVSVIKSGLKVLIP